MAEHDYVVSNAGGSAVRSDINSFLNAIVSKNSKTTEPTAKFAFEWWMDTTANILKIRDSANAAWVNVASLSGTTWIPYRSGTLLGTASLADTGTANAEVVINSSLKGTAREYGGQQNFDLKELTDGANISWNLNTQQVASVVIGGTRTLDNPTNSKDGGVYILKVIQDNSGIARTLSYGSKYIWPGGVAPVLTTGNNKFDVLTFFGHATFMLGVVQKDFS